MGLNKHIFTSDWKAPHFWNARERLEIKAGTAENPEEECVYLEIVTQGIVGRILDFLGSLFGKEHAFGRTIKSTHAIKIPLSEAQRTQLSRALQDDPTLSVEELEYRLEHQIYTFALNVLLPEQHALPGIQSSQDSVEPASTPSILSTSSSIEDPIQKESIEKQIDSLVSSFVEEADEFVEEVDEKAFFSDDILPANLTYATASERFQAAKLAFDKIYADERQAISAQYEESPASKKLRGMASVALGYVDWIAEPLIPGYRLAKQAAAKTVELLTPEGILERTAAEDDPCDLAMLERMEKPMQKLREELKELTPFFVKGTEGYKEFKELRRQVEASYRTLAVLHEYFDACDTMDAALDACGDQQERWNQGRPDFSFENYVAVVRRAQFFFDFKESTKTILNPFWQHRIEKKCRYHLDQATGYLGEFTYELTKESSAELHEAAAQCRHIQELIAEEASCKATFQLENLTDLHAAYCRFKAIHDKTTEFANELERLCQHLPPEMLASLKEDTAAIISISTEAQKTFPSMDSQFEASVSLLLLQLEKYAHPKDILINKLNSYERELAKQVTAVNKEEHDKKLARCYAALAFLGQHVPQIDFPELPQVEAEKSAAIQAELGKALQAVGKEAERRSQEHDFAYSFKDLFENVYRDAAPLTRAKQKVLESHKHQIENTPSGLLKWRIFFGWLQLWDTVSPLAGLAAKVGMGMEVKAPADTGYNFHLHMMGRTGRPGSKDYDPEQYAYHLECARSAYFGLHTENQEFLTKYDEYLRGDVSYGLEKIPTPDSLGSPLKRTFSLFEPQSSKPADLEVAPVSWWDAFMGRNPAQVAMKDKSEWEKWCHYTIYPQVRDRHFDAILDIFDELDLAPPPEKSSAEERLTYHFYRMYQSLKIPAGDEEYQAHLELAKEIHQYNPFLKEYHSYLQDRRPAFELPLMDIPISTVPLGKEVVNQLKHDTTELAAYLFQVQEETGDPALKDQRLLVKQHQQFVQDLASQAPAEYADQASIKAWLKAVKTYRSNYLNEKNSIRSVAVSKKFEGLISVIKLKRFIQNPILSVSKGIFAQVFGLSNTGDMLEVFNYHLDFVKKKLGVARTGTLCTDEKAAAFCAEYLNNPKFKEALEDTSLLDALAEKVAQAQILTDAFKKEPPELFSKRLQTLLSSMQAEDTAFFIDKDASLVHDIIKQSDNRFTIRHYSIDHKGHPQFSAGSEHTVSPYTAIADVPISALNDAELGKILANTWTPSSSTLEYLKNALLDFFAGKHITVNPFDFTHHRTNKPPSSAYQLLTALFLQPFNEAEAGRFVFESQLKALADFQHVHSRLYNQEDTRLLVEQASTSFLAHIQTWHEKHIISDEELQFSLEIVRNIEKTVKTAQEQQIAALKQTTSLPALNNLKAQTALIKNPLTLAYTELEEAAPELAAPAPRPYIAPLIFHQITGEGLSTQLQQLNLNVRTANRLGLYDNAIVAVHRFVEKIPILDQAFWKAIADSKQDPHQLIEQINDLSNEYHWSLLKRPTTDPHHPLGSNIGSNIRAVDYFTQIKLFKIAHKLYKMKPLDLYKEDIEKLSIPLYLPIFHSLFEGQLAHLQAPNPQWARELQAIKKDWYVMEASPDHNFPSRTFFLPGRSLSYLHSPPYNSLEWASILTEYLKEADATQKNPLVTKFLNKIVKKGVNFPGRLKDGIIEPLFVPYILADGLFEIWSIDDSAAFNELHEIRTFKKGGLESSNPASDIVFHEDVSPIPKVFYTLRDMAVRTDLLFSYDSSHEISREDFDMGIKWNIRVTIDNNKKNIYYKDSFRALNVFGKPWEWKKGPQAIEDISRLEKEVGAFDSYLYSSDFLLYSGSLYGLIRTRHFPQGIMEEALARHNNGDKNPPELIHKMLTLSSIEELQATESLSFYTQNLHLLGNRDHQLFLKFLLLEPGILQAELSKHPKDNLLFVESLAAFLRKGILAYSSMDDVVTASFLLNLSQEVFSHVLQIQKNYQADRKTLIEDLSKEFFFHRHRDKEEEFKKLLEMDGMSDFEMLFYLHVEWQNSCILNVAKWEEQLKQSKENANKLKKESEETSHLLSNSHLEEGLVSNQRKKDILQFGKQSYQYSLNTCYLREQLLAGARETLELSKKTFIKPQEINDNGCSEEFMSLLREEIDKRELNYYKNATDYWNDSLIEWKRILKISQGEEEELQIIKDELHKATDLYSTYHEKLKDANEKFIHLHYNDPDALSDAASKLGAYLWDEGIKFLTRRPDEAALNAKFAAYKNNLRTANPDLFPLNFSFLFMDVSKEYHKLLAKPDLKLETVSFLYSKLALSYGTQKNLTQEQAQDLLQAVIASSLHPAPKDSLSQTDKAQLKGLLYEKQHEIRLLLGKDSNPILNKLYSHFHKGASELQWSGTFPRYSALDGLVMIDALEGKLYENGGQTAYMDETIIQHPVYKQFFGDTPLALTTKVKGGYPREVYLMMGADHHSYRLIAEAGGLTIQRKFGDTWCQLTDKEEALNSFGLPRALVGTYAYWHDKQEVFLTDKATSAVRYHVANSPAGKQIQVMDATGKPAGLLLADPASCPLTGVFSRIEDSQEMLVYQDVSTGLAKEYELPRLGLSFKVEEGGRIICPELESFMLSSDQHIGALGHLKNYLVLEKKTKSGDDRKIALFATAGVSSAYAVYDLDLRTKKLVPRTESDSFYLAKMLLNDHAYEQAFDRLQAYQHQLRPLEADSLNILAEFLDSRDTHPRAITVQLKAMAMLARQKTDLGQKRAEVNAKQLLETYGRNLGLPHDDKRDKLRTYLDRLLSKVPTEQLMPTNEELSSEERVKLSTYIARFFPEGNVKQLLNIYGRYLELLDEDKRATLSVYLDHLLSEVDAEQLLETYGKYLLLPHDDKRVKLNRDDENLILRQCAHLLDEASGPLQHAVLQRKRELGHPLSLQQNILLHAATLIPGKIPGKVLGFSDITATTLAKITSLDSQFALLYEHIRQKEFYPHESDLRQLAASFADLKSPLPESQSEILKAFNESLDDYLKNGPEDKALASLLLKAVMAHPQAFPLDLRPLETFKDSKGKQTWLRKEVTGPLRQAVSTDPSLQNYVYGIPEYMPLASVKLVEPAMRHQSPALPIASPLYSLPVTTLQKLSISLVMPTDEMIQADLKVKNEVKDFLGQNLNDTLTRNSLQAMQMQSVAYYNTTQTLSPVYTIDDKKKFDEAIGVLQERSRKAGNELETKKEKLEALANKLPEDPTQQAIMQARLLTGEQTPLSLEDCLILFLYLRKNPQLVLARNPALTPADIRQLFTLTRDYLLAASDKQHLDAILAFSQDKELLPKMAAEVERVRAYDIEEFPEYLLLEYASTFWLTQAQVDSLNTLLKDFWKISDVEVSKLLELIMGAGKSSMLIPLLSYFLTGGGRRLAVTVMPKRLIESMAKDYQERIYKAFQQTLFLFDFDRNSPCDTESLSRLLELLEGAMRDRRPVLMASESLNALFLKFGETMSDFLSNRRKDSKVSLPAEELRYFKSIFKLLKEHGSIIIDEIDMVLDVLKSFHFTIGQPKKLNDVNPLIGQIVMDFFRFLQAHPELHKGLKLDVSSIMGNQPFSKEIYEKEVKGGLINAIVEGLFIQGDLAVFLSKLNKDQKKLVSDFLHGKRDAKTLAFTDTLSHPVQDSLALLSESLNTLLPLTAPKRLLEHFGLEWLKDQEGNLSVPFHNGNRSPEGTQFGTDLEILFYSIRAHREKGISEAMVKKHILELRQSAIMETQAGGITDIEDTVAGKQFRMLVGKRDYQLFSIVEDDYPELTRIINSKPENVFSFIEKYVITEVEFYEKQLNADAQLFGILFSHIFGLTGTAWNADTMPKIISSIMHSSTAAKTLHILFKNSPRQVAVVPAPADSGPVDILSLVRSMQENSQDATSIIDVGNIFRGQSPQEVCKALLTVANEKGWNKKECGTYIGDQIVVVTLENGEAKVSKKSKPSKDNSLFFWPLAYTTGSDIILSSTMQAVVSVSRHTLLRDLLQAIWRLRGLDVAQGVRFLMTDEDEKVIRQVVEAKLKRSVKEIGMEELILYTIIEQAGRQGTDNYRSFKQKLNAILLEKTFKSLLEASPEEMLQIYEACSGLFESTQNERPYELYAQPTEKVAKELAIERDIEKFLNGSNVRKFLEMFSSSYTLEKLKAEALELKNRELARLPDEIVTGSDYGKERSVQTQTEMKTESNTQKESNVDVETTTEVTDKWLNRIRHKWKAVFSNLKTWPLQGLLDSDYFSGKQGKKYAMALSMQKVFEQDLAEYADLFDSNLLCSTNACTILTNGKTTYWQKFIEPSLTHSLPIFNAQQAHCNKVLVIEDKKTSELKMLLLDARDEKQFRKLLIYASKNQEMHKGSLGQNRLALVDLYTGIYQQDNSKDPIEAVRLEADPAFQRLKVQAKFQKGEIHYTSNELPHLEAWLKTAGVEKLKQLFLEEILPARFIGNDNIDWVKFSHSNLAKLFAKLK